MHTAIGFLFSGAALGIYFRSWINLIVPSVTWVVLFLTPGDAGFWIGAAIGGVWGLLRAVNSNERYEHRKGTVKMLSAYLGSLDANADTNRGHTRRY